MHRTVAVLRVLKSTEGSNNSRIPPDREVRGLRRSDACAASRLRRVYSDKSNPVRRRSESRAVSKPAKRHASKRMANDETTARPQFDLKQAAQEMARPRQELRIISDQSSGHHFAFVLVVLRPDRVHVLRAANIQLLFVRRFSDTANKRADKVAGVNPSTILSRRSFIGMKSASAIMPVERQTNHSSLICGAQQLHN